MCYCAIRWCGKNSKTSNYKTNGITFHRFPNDPDLKEKWIDCTKRETWCPGSYSVVCSQHFTEDCFNTVKNRRRLFNTAIPTLNLPVVINKSENPTCSQENASAILSSSYQYDPSISTIPRAAKRKIADETFSKFHFLANKQLCRRVIQLSSEVKLKNKTIKVLRDQVRYLKNKVTFFKGSMMEIKEKVLQARDADIIKNNVVPTE